jgi:hypothetical protein
MQVDTSVALGRDDPALEFPWTSDDRAIRYCDLRSNPALMDQIPEAHYPELREFLLRVNARDFFLQTAKSDIWITGELSPDEEIFAADRKLVSYVDLIFSSVESRYSFEAHELLASQLCKLLQKAPEMPAAVEFVIRHCHYHPVQPIDRDTTDPGRGSSESILPSQASSSQDNGFSQNRGSSQGDSSSEGHTPKPGGMAETHLGFALTAYVSGLGTSDAEARQRWSVALKLLQYAAIQIKSL